MTALENKEQVKQSMGQLIDFLADNEIVRHDKEIFTISGQWTVPSGVTRVYVSGCGGGGGGSAVYGCGGGGAASVFRKPVNVTPGEKIQITIGLGGRGNQSSHSPGVTDHSHVGNVSGEDGTATTFGRYLTLNGGKGAVASVNGEDLHYYGGDYGGEGGTSGEMMHVSIILADSARYTFLGGKGGDSLYGHGGTGGQYSILDYKSKVGEDGIGFGAGGGGGTLYTSVGLGSWLRAGSGTNGILIVEW